LLTTVHIYVIAERAMLKLQCVLSRNKSYEISCHINAI